MFMLYMVQYGTAGARTRESASLIIAHRRTYVEMHT